MNNRSFEHSPADYQIKVKGRIGDHWSEWFGDVKIETEGSVTTFAAKALDQPAVHSLLTRIRDLNLILISVKRIGHNQ